MPPFGLFRKSKKEEEPQPPEPQPQEKQQSEEPTTTDQQPTPQDPTPEQPTTEPQPPQPEKTEPETPPTTYLKAMPLRELTDLENIENEVKNGNIVILRITPLASKSIEQVKQAVDQLYTFTETINGDIARLGEERIVICPKPIKIWREKIPAQTAPLSTAA